MTVRRGIAIVPVVFVHGTRTTAAIWTHQLAAVRRRGHEAVAIDLPGHGVRHAERFTMAGALAVIADAVRRFDEPPVLVGLSLGGYTSLAYAARNPGTVAGLVLSGCSTEIRGKPLSAYRAASMRIAQAVRPGRHTWHVVSDMLGAMRGHSSIEDLRRIGAPVWFVNGSRDVLRLDERRFLAAHRTARLHVVRRAGHDVNTHAPEAFNRILLDVLASFRAQSRQLAVALP